MNIRSLKHLTALVNAIIQFKHHFSETHVMFVVCLIQSGSSYQTSDTASLMLYQRVICGLFCLFRG